MIVQRKTTVYFWMLVAMTSAILLYIGFLVVEHSPFTGDIRYLSISLFLFLLSFLLLRKGHYFWSVNTSLIAIVIPMSAIVYFGETLSELKLYNMALFHVVALVFAMLVTNHDFHLYGLGAASVAILSLFMFARLLPQAGERAANYWPSYATSVLVVIPVTLMGVWIRGLLHDSLEELTYKFKHDSETGLLNKASLVTDLEKRDTGQKTGQVVFYRLLNLDEITLNFGSETRVQVILRFSGLAGEQHCGPVYRINENTLACVTGLEWERDKEIAAALIEKARHSCRVGDLQIHLNMKASIIDVDDEGSAENLINQGLLGLYQAQKNNRPFYLIDRHQDSELLRKLDLINNLATAVSENECYVHYQPIVNGAGEICALEALARWSSKTGVAIGPDIFIPLLESSGLMNRFFEGILDTVLTDREGWSDTHGSLEIYINLSAVMFEQGYDFIALADRLVERKTDLRTIGFEITESAVLQDERSNILEVMTELSKRGVRFAMDDFGTGYTNFARFLTFPFDKIKLDKSLLDNMETDMKSRRLLEILIPYFNSQKIQTVCEGIETPTQFELLKSFGCEYFQGFHFLRPQSAGEMGRILKSGAALPIRR